MKYQMTLLTLLTLIILTGSFALSYTIINFKPDNYIEKEKNDSNDSTNDAQNSYSIETEKEINRDYKLTLNGKEVTLPITFSSTIKCIEDDRYRTIEGKFKDHIIYSLSELKDKYSIKTDPLNNSKVSDTIKSNNFKIIKGQDGRDYLLIITNFIPLDSGINYTQNLYILNDQLDLIYDSSKDEQLSEKEYFTIITGNIGVITEIEGSSPWYEDTFGSCVNDEICNVKVKIEENKIYYLMTKDFDSLEERVYTINNSKLEYDTIKHYQIKKVINLPN